MWKIQNVMLTPQSTQMKLKTKKRKKVNSMGYYVWSPFQEVNPPTGLNFSEKQEYMANMANFHILL